MRLGSGLLGALLFVTAGCSGGHVQSDSAPAPASSPTTTWPTASEPGKFAVSSPAFAEDKQIPEEYSCDGRNVPPPLRWQNLPPGAESLAVVVDDPDAPAGLYVHWVVTGIPPSTTEIVSGTLPPAAVVSLNSANRAEYLGPCPPSGTGAHHYRFKLYALRQAPTLTPMTPATESTTTIADLSIAVTDTVGTFGH
ncbi:MAG TPA: YbhB/YbcL family Raf kinase inhibitor-like protein [Mycobacterium sp.]|nr:YbhB/YbcL family Raf kinase inhibitor-like protein [Mycobacterium sp.]